LRLESLHHIDDPLLQGVYEQDENVKETPLSVHREINKEPVTGGMLGSGAVVRAPSVTVQQPKPTVAGETRQFANDTLNDRVSMPAGANTV